MTDWIKERENDHRIIWQNKKDPTIRVEAKYIQYGRFGRWYVMPTQNQKMLGDGYFKGCKDKKEAISLVASFKEQYDKYGNFYSGQVAFFNRLLR